MSPGVSDPPAEPATQQLPLTPHDHVAEPTGRCRRKAQWVIALVVVLIGYHHACGSLLKKFERGENKRSHTWFRWFNEVPVLVLLAIVILVVVKPF